MSFSEILNAVNALSQAEKIQLVHALVDLVSGPRRITPEEDLITKIFAQDAAQHTGWQATTDKAGIRALHERAEIVSPILAPEAAAALAALLAEDRRS